MNNLGAGLYGMSEDPFRLSPDPRFSFFHDSYKKAMAYMEYAIKRSEGFIVVTGPPGTGKTTLIGNLVNSLKRSNYVVSSVTTSALDRGDLLKLVAGSFGCEVTGKTKSEILIELKETLERYFSKGKKSILIIDEAQGLTHDALEEVRLLSNLQKGNILLVQILLVGQESLLKLIEHPDIEQLRQRVIAAAQLRPLNFDETLRYIIHRLKKGGWKGSPTISAEAIKEVYAHSGGIPRLINLICSRSLFHASVEQSDQISIADVKSVIEGLTEEKIINDEQIKDDVYNEQVRSAQILLDTVMQEFIHQAQEEIDSTLDMRGDLNDLAGSERSAPDLGYTDQVTTNGATPGYREVPQSLKNPRKHRARKIAFSVLLIAAFLLTLLFITDNSVKPVVLDFLGLMSST